MNKVANLIFCFSSLILNAQVKKYTLLECVNIALEKNIREEDQRALRSIPIFSKPINR